MPAFVETYSANMRAALFRAAIDEGHGTKGALRLAAAGELPDLSSEDQTILAGMAYAYAASQVKDERDRRGEVRKVRADTTETAHELAARLAALADREVAQLEATKRRTPVDTGRALAAAKLMREALALARDASGQGKTNGKTAAPAPAEPARQRSLASRIAAASDSAAGDDDTTPSDSGDNGAPRATQTAEKTNGRGAGAVRLRAAAPASEAPASSGV